MDNVLALQKMAPEATTAAIRWSVLSIYCDPQGNSTLSVRC